MEFYYCTSDALIQNQNIGTVTKNSKRDITLVHELYYRLELIHAPGKNKVIRRATNIKCGVLAHWFIYIKLFFR